MFFCIRYIWIFEFIIRRGRRRRRGRRVERISSCACSFVTRTMTNLLCIIMSVCNVHALCSMSMVYDSMLCLWL